MRIPPLAADWVSPDPILYPYFYQGITTRRIIAYFIDLFILSIIGLMVWGLLAMVGLLTLGLTLPLFALLPLLPVGYHALLVSGPFSSTIGMRLMGIEVRSLVEPSSRPNIVQALIQIAVFYLTVPPTGGLVLLLALLHPQRRTLQDLLSGTIVLSRAPSL